MTSTKRKLLRCDDCGKPIYFYGKKIGDKWYHKKHVPKGE